MKKLLNAMGFDIVRYRSPLERNLGLDERLGFELEDEATACIQVVRHNTMLSKRRLVTLYQQVAYCERYGIPGAFVECGVWKGGAMGMMAQANMQTGKSRRHLHLFDVFQEICEPDAAVDGEKALREVQQYMGSGHDKGKLQPLTGIYNFMGGPGTLAENRKLLEKTIGYPVELLQYHVGWFQETLPAVHEAIGPIAILRLDGDWYASTKVCLEYLFDKVVKGGIVIIDDYGTYEGCRRAVDEFMNTECVQAYLGSIDSDCRYFVKL
ncbi:MAG: TylF/MycF/NovP-related O-methyltransferase [Deltaproteobacteria bacterium]